MYRSISLEDVYQLKILLQVVGLFESEQLCELSDMLAEYFAVGDGDQEFWMVDDDNGIVGVVYCEAERMTSGTWNLQLLAIRPECQRSGRGEQLLKNIEQTLIERGARLL